MSGQTEREAGAFKELMDRLRRGDAATVGKFIAEYEKYVASVVRRYRSAELRSKFDLEDYVQEVWKSFFGKLPELHFEHPHVLRAFLFRLTHNQVVGTTVQFLQTQKCNVRRELSLEDPCLDARTLVSPEAPPGKKVDCQDEIDWILKDAPRLGHEIARHIQDGDSQKEAARSLHVAEKTVGRFLQHLRSRRRR